MPKFVYFLYRFFTFSTQFYLKTDAYLVLSDQFTFSLFFFKKHILGLERWLSGFGVLVLQAWGLELEISVLI